jgi:MerR family transcriptional regulator/heat shock protein HspR
VTGPRQRDPQGRTTRVTARITVDLPDDAPVYVISVAAELSGMHPQTLRQYDRLGLVSPGRSGGGGRRYSLRDIETLREVARLSQQEGVSLEGIRRILALEEEAAALRARVTELTERLAMAEAELARAGGSARHLPARLEDTFPLPVWSPQRRPRG